MSIGTTEAILVLFGEVQVLIDSRSAKVSDANLTSLFGILSIPAAFLEFRDLRMVLMSLGVILEPQVEEGMEMELDCKFLFLWIFAILG